MVEQRYKYFGVYGKLYTDSWREFSKLFSNIDLKYYSSDYCDFNINKYGILVIYL